MGSLDSWDDDPDKKVRDAFRQGYVDGFSARIRKLVYPGVRLNTDKQLDAEIDAHLRSRR